MLISGERLAGGREIVEMSFNLLLTFMRGDAAFRLGLVDRALSIMLQGVNDHDRSVDVAGVFVFTEAGLGYCDKVLCFALPGYVTRSQPLLVHEVLLSKDSEKKCMVLYTYDDISLLSNTCVDLGAKT